MRTPPGARLRSVEESPVLKIQRHRRWRPNLAPGLAVLALLVACAPPSLRPSPEALAEAEQSPGTALVRAEEARLAGARRAEATPGLVDGLELMVSDRSGDDDIPLGEGTRFAVQVPLRMPWESASVRKARQEESAEAGSRLDRATLQREVEACFVGTEIAIAKARQEAFEPHAALLRELLDVIARQVEAGVLTEAEALRVEVDARTRLLSKEPAPVDLPGHEATPLPLFDASRPPLSTSPATVRSLIHDRHPEPRIHQAASRRYDALASREMAATVPWIDDVRLSYDLPGLEREARWGGRVSVRIPFGGDQRSKAATYQGKSAGESYEAAARISEYTQEAIRALRELSFLESRAEHWNALIALAERSEAVARKLLDKGREDLSDLISLLGEAQTARQAFLSARERAALASCALLESTGVKLADWPRDERTEVLSGKTPGRH